MMRPMSVHVTSLPPYAPGSLSAAHTPDVNHRVVVRWVDGTPVDYAKPSTWGDRHNEIGYRVERADVVNGRPGTFSQIGTAFANATSFTDSAADPSKTYLYRVIAWNEGGEVFSDTLTVPGVKIPRVVLTASTNRSTYGTQVRFSVAVSGPNGSVVPSGTVTLRVSNPNGPDLVLNSPLVRVGQVAITNWPTSALLGGINNAVVSYSGDATYLDSTSNQVTVVIDPRGTSTSLSVSKNPVVWGEPVSFTATVNGFAGGVVTFNVDGVPGAPVALVNGRAVLTTSSLAVGTHNVRASYSGSPNALPSNSSAVSVTVGRSSSRTTLLASSVNLPAGATVIFTATVSAVAPGAGTPAGTVQFRTDNGVVLASSVPVGAGGQAVFTTAALARGTRQVTAVYSGGANFSGSTSSTISVTIR